MLAFAISLMRAVALVLCTARSVLGLTIFALVIGLLVDLLQRHGFFDAVRRGSIAGLHVRPTEVSDENVPILRSRLGPRTAETLEMTADPSYRESARSP